MSIEDGQCCVYHSNFITLQSKTTHFASLIYSKLLCISLKFYNFAI